MPPAESTGASTASATTSGTSPISAWRMVSSRGDGLSQVSLGPASRASTDSTLRRSGRQTLGNDLGGFGEARQTLSSRPSRSAG